MKRFLTWVFILTWMFTLTSVFTPKVLADSNTQIAGSTQTYVTDSSNATVQLVAGATGVKYTLLGYIVSVSSSDNIYFECGTTQQTGLIYLGANSGLQSFMNPFSIKCAAGQALQLVKGTNSTPLSITFWYSTSN